MEPRKGDEQVHVPPPSLWPIGFAVGIAVILVGLIVDPVVIAPIGGAIAIVFGFLWVREATAEYRRPPGLHEPETREAGVGDAPALPAPADSDRSGIGDARRRPPDLVAGTRL